MYRIGIDLGGTKIEGIIIDNNGDEITRLRIPTEQIKGYNHIIFQISKLYFQLVEKIDRAEHSFGICTPGSISFKTGLMKNSNTTCLNSMPFKIDLEKKISRKFAIQNDANCFAMAEAIYGAGKGKQSVFGVIMGTGCGGGIVFDGKVVDGLMGIAGEWGHSVIDPNGPECYCGKKGCIETFISGTGVENHYRNVSGDILKLQEIMNLYKQNHKIAKQIINSFLNYFGLAISNLINILDPDIIVLGGGVSNIPILYTDGIKAIEKYVFNDYFSTPVVKNVNGDSAGVIGAALIGI